MNTLERKLKTLAVIEENEYARKRAITQSDLALNFSARSFNMSFYLTARWQYFVFVLSRAHYLTTAHVSFVK